MSNSTPDRRSPLALFPGQPAPRLPVIQRAVPGAVLRAGVAGRATGHTFRHSFAAHLPQDGYDIRTVQELLGHPGVKATMAYPGVLNAGCAPPRLAAESPVQPASRDNQTYRSG